MAKKNQMKKVFLTINVGPKAEESEIQEFKKYIGVAPVFVTAINPTKEEQEQMYGYSLKADPEYYFDTNNGPAFKLEFHVKTDPNWNGTNIATTGRIRFVISNRVRISRDETKVQVIDDYGETAWVTKDQYKTQARPDKCRVFGKYRACHEGEADLVSFLKEWLNVEPSYTTWNKENCKWISKTEDELEKCKLILNWEELAKGNISELQELVKTYNDYLVKVCFGVRTTENNRHYQDICNKVFLRNTSKSFDVFEKQIGDLKRIDMYANTQFSSECIHEWKINKTTFENTITDQPVGVAPNPNEYEAENDDDLPF